MKRACVLFVVILSTLNNELLAYKKYICIYTYICIIVSNIVMIWFIFFLEASYWISKMHALFSESYT